MITRHGGPGQPPEPPPPLSRRSRRSFLLAAIETTDRSERLLPQQAWTFSDDGIIHSLETLERGDPRTGLSALQGISTAWRVTTAASQRTARVQPILYRGGGFARSQARQRGLHDIFSP